MSMRQIKLAIARARRISDAKRRRDAIALLRILELGEKDVEAGRLIPAHEAFARLRRRLRQKPPAKRPKR